MRKKFLFEYDRDELKDVIRECLSECNILQHEAAQAENEEDRMTQKQTARYLDVSEVTLIDWKKKGLVPFHQVPNTRRVYFLKSELKKVSWQNKQLIHSNKIINNH